MSRKDACHRWEQAKYEDFSLERYLKQSIISVQNRLNTNLVTKFGRIWRYLLKLKRQIWKKKIHLWKSMHDLVLQTQASKTSDEGTNDTHIHIEIVWRKISSRKGAAFYPGTTIRYKNILTQKSISFDWLISFQRPFYWVQLP